MTIARAAHRSRQIRALAIHEASHCITAHTLGAAVEFVDVDADRRNGGTRVRGFDLLPQPTKLTILSAGQAGEILAGLSPNDGYRDAADAAAILPADRMRAEAMLDTAIEDASRILRARWASVLRLARLLEADGVLEGEQLARILAAVPIEGGVQTRSQPSNRKGATTKVLRVYADGRLVAEVTVPIDATTGEIADAGRAVT